MENSKNEPNININEQLKNLTPEAVENAQSAVFKGQINFIKKSPLKWIYLFVFGIVILLLIFFGVTAVKMYIRSREFDREFEKNAREMEENEREMEESRREFYEEYEENKKIIEEGREFIQNKMNEGLENTSQ